MIETGFQKLQILSIVVKFSLIFFYFFLFEQGDIKTLLWNTFGLKKKLYGKIFSTEKRFYTINNESGM